MSDLHLPGIDDVRAAVPRVSPYLHQTPLLSSRTLSERTGLEVWLKCECLQKTGSFKPRGALNRIATLSQEERDAGVITISAGNNAQGVAFAARAADVHAVLVMPETAVASKVAATRAYGAEVVLHGDVHEAFEKLEELRRDRSLTLLHPFDDPMLIAGHGTLGLEIDTQMPEAEAIVCGVGGGGLCGGLGVVCGGIGKGTRLFAVEPEGAPTMTAAIAAGEPVRLEHVESIADGLAPPFVGHLNLEAAQRFVEQVTLVSDDEIRRALGLVLERAKLVIEPSAAAPVAALLEHRLPLDPGSRVVVVLSGGNLDLDRLPEFIPTSMSRTIS
ncbi:MAG TPA: threonine/serine dehydratase [Acidobacteriota bacterium]|nr:threonine/serine dehydratase [Acidobacteriota bacterium]